MGFFFCRERCSIPSMESDFIAWLRDNLPPHPQLRLGPGDDAALLSLTADAGCVVSSDMLTDGVDFVLAETDARRIGRKALAVNLSDLAAMAARPLAAIVSLVVPRDGGLRLAVDIYEGLLPLAAQFDVAIAGGDTNSWDGPLVISVTVIGEEAGHGVWPRGGAKIADQILVTGSFGGSILGRHFDFTPRVTEALTLAASYQIHAATDVSDGLSLDLSHVLTESGCGACLDLERVPISDDARRLAAASSRTPLDHALGDGEDFELILTASRSEAARILSDHPVNVPLTPIGEVIELQGLWYRAANGQLAPIPPCGYEH